MSAVDPVTSRWAARAPWLLLAAAVAVLLATFRDYGLTWDEHVQWTYGELALAYFRSGGADTSCNDYLNLHYYGAWYEALLAALYQAVPAWKIDLRHLITALTGLSAIAAIILAARHWRLGSMALIAAAALLLTPRFYGDLCANSKDIPFLATFAWAMAAIMGLLATRALTWPRVLALALAIGLALGVRMGALLLYGFLAAALATVLLQTWRGAAPGSPYLSIALKLAALGVLSWAVMVAGWPWAQGGWLTRPIEAFQFASHFPTPVQVFTDGQYLPSTALPGSYLPKLVLITLPLPVLALALLGLVLTVRDQWRDWRAPAAALGLLLQLWVLFPLAYALLTHPSVYDGMRHFLFILPGVALAAGRGGAGLIAGAHALRQRRVLLVLLLGLLATTLPAMVRLHPYQYTYFNPLVGGVGHAWQRYDSDYWAASYREAMAWINTQSAAPGAPAPLVVVVAANQSLRVIPATYAGPNVELHTVWGANDPWPAHWDYYVATTRFAMASLAADRPIVQRIGRDGAIFTVIRRGPDRPATAPPAPPTSAAPVDRPLPNP